MRTIKLIFYVFLSFIMLFYVRSFLNTDEENKTNITIDSHHIYLPKDNKKTLFRELVEIESKANEESKQKYPTSPDYSESLNLANLKNQSNFEENKRQEFQKKHHLTNEQMIGLSVEGSKEGW